MYCSSPLAHLGLCSQSTTKANPVSIPSSQLDPSHTSPEMPPTTCSTGLRVYDGASVLAEFFASRFFADSCSFFGATDDMGASAVRSEGRRPFVAVELGCGCGLAGLTLWYVLNGLQSATAAHVILTDASLPCLAYVERNFQLLSAATLGNDAATTTTFDAQPLDWEHPEGFYAESPSCGVLWGTAGKTMMDEGRVGGGADVVFGSDLVYFNANPQALFRVAQLLMRCRGAENSAAAHQTPPPPVLLLCHHCRISNGVRTLVHAAAQNGLVLFHLPLTHFVPAAEILPRARGGMHFLVGCRVDDVAYVQSIMFGVRLEELESSALNSDQEVCDEALAMLGAFND